MTPNVAVVGGGWAGCAAALTLAEAGVRVTLYEAAHTLGGRARAVEFDGETLDNGQHILLGAYAQTLALIARFHRETDVLWRLPLALEQPPAFRLACPRLPAPLHLAAGLASARGLRWGEKLAATRWIHGQLRDGKETTDVTVGTLTRDQPEAVNRLLWHPLCVSALNTPPEHASARVFRNVLRAAFTGRAGHSDLLLPRCDLTALFPAPAAARLVELGGTLRQASRVAAIEATSNHVALATRDDVATYSHVILAVAPQHLPALLSNIPALETIRRALARYEYQPIATLYLQVDPAFRLPKPLLALGDGPAQFVFDRGQSHGQAGLLALVASAATVRAEDWATAAEAQLRRITDPGPARRHRRIAEKQATYACTPDLSRPPCSTAHPRVFLAGDFTAGAYPATLESATLSGVQSAGALLDSL